MLRMFSMVLGLLVLTTASFGQNIVKGAMGKELDELVLRSALGQYWGAVLVAKDGEILLAKGYGVANEALDPMDGHSLFDIGSIGKCFTAAAILKLEQDGKLSVDDPAVKFFPDAGDTNAAITLRHLVNHTSGVPREVPSAWTSGDDRDFVVTALLKAPPARKPGIQFEYSNIGYFILAGVIEKVSGMSWEKYLTEHIMRPAGMTGSGCCGDETLNKTKLTSRQDRDWSINGDAAVWPYPLTWGYKGSGGVVSSAVDMFAWDQALRGDKVLGAAAKTKMFEPALNGYAMGWYVQRSGPGRIATHTGGVRGYATYITRWLDRDMCIVILTNGRTNLTQLMKDLTAKVSPESADSTSFEANFTGQTGTEHGMYAFAGDLKVTAEKLPSGGVAVLVHDGAKDAPAIKVQLSRNAADVFSEQLHIANGQVQKAGAKPETRGVQLEVYTASYRLAKDAPLKRDGQGVSLKARAGTMHPEPGGDHKVLIFLQDETRQMLPMFLKLELGDAAELANHLEKAMKN